MASGASKKATVARIAAPIALAALVGFLVGPTSAQPALDPLAGAPASEASVAPTAVAPLETVVASPQKGGAPAVEASQAASATAPSETPRPTTAPPRSATPSARPSTIPSGTASAVASAKASASVTPPSIPPPNPSPVATATPTPVDRTFASFDQTMRAVLAEGGFPGGALAIVRDGRLVYAQGYGARDASGSPYTPTTISRLASLSKPITQSRLRQMIAAGQLGWDTKVFPLLGIAPADPRANAITVAHLARHTSGISGDHFFEAREAATAYGVASPPDADTMVRWTAHYPLAADPGSTYRYNNTNYAILSRVMERAAGRSYIDLMREMAACAEVSRWRLGASLARAADETTYYDGATAQSIFDSAPGTVPWPYGGYHVENLMGAVSLASSVIDVARYGAALERCIPRPEDSQIPTLAGYSYGYDMRGSMPGQLTYWLRKWDGAHLTQIVAFFNERTLSAFDEAVAGRLWAAAAQVAAWPAVDRFSEYP